MIHQFPSIRLLLALLLLGMGIAQPCLAQEEDEIQVQFVCFPPSPGNNKAELVTGDGKVIEVELPSNALSEVYTMVKPAQWVLGRRVVDEEGNPSFEVHGKVGALAAKRQIVLVTRKGVKNEDGLVMNPFAADSDGLGGGKYLFFNAAKVDLACELGSLQFKLLPGQHRLLAPDPSEMKNDRGYLYTRMYFRKGKEAKAFYESTWRYNKKAKSLVFIYHDEHTLQLRTHSIRSFR